jgi:hypothetical protein
VDAKRPEVASGMACLVECVGACEMHKVYKRDVMALLAVHGTWDGMKAPHCMGTMLHNSTLYGSEYCKKGWSAV